MVPRPLRRRDASGRAAIDVVHPRPRRRRVHFSCTSVEVMPNSVETSDGSPEVAAAFVVVQAGPRRLCLCGELDMAGVAKSA